MNLPLLPDPVLDGFLAEDVSFLDLTTHVLGIGDRAGRMSFAARDPMVVACIEDAARLVSRTGADVSLHAVSGERRAAGDILLSASGSAASLLRAWKVAQTLVEVASGIATAARAVVDAARAVKPSIAVTCTRKTAPGTKSMSFKAILAGGATPHRLGLGETILIFAEHRSFLPGMPGEIVALLKREAAEKKTIVEVASKEEAMVWALAGADVIQCEKFPPGEIAALCRNLSAKDERPLVAAAGGVNAGNAALYAGAGADILVTSAPYWAKPAEVAVRLKSASSSMQI